MISLSHLNVQLRLLPQVVVSRIVALTLLQVLANILLLMVRLLVALLVGALVGRQLVEVQLGHQFPYELLAIDAAFVPFSATNVLVGIFRVKAELIVRFTVTGLEGCFEGAHDLVEPVRGQRLEVVLLVDLVDRDPAVHLQTVEEEEQLRQLLGLVVLPLFAVF